MKGEFDDPDSIELGSAYPPAVIYDLAKVLPGFRGDDLESQLQTFDVFLNILAPSVRTEFRQILMTAAGRTDDAPSRLRIQQAAESIANGGRAAEPYNHAEAMRRYREEQAPRTSEPVEDDDLEAADALDLEEDDEDSGDD